MNKLACIFNWSGGKDSSLALYHCLQNPELDIRYLVTSINDNVNRISMHGVRHSLLLEQAKQIGIPLYEIRLPEMPTMSAYDSTMKSHLEKLKAEGKIFAGMIPKLDNAFAALNSGVKKVVIGKAEQLKDLINGESGTSITNS